MCIAQTKKKKEKKQPAYSRAMNTIKKNVTNTQKKLENVMEKANFVSKL